jgi:signal transduction histidine kinase
MIEMDGLDVIRALAKRGPLPPLVMVTGTGNEEVAVEAMKLGADDYLVKDLDGGYLKLIPTLIHDVLQKRSLQREKGDALAALTERERQYREIFHQLRSIIEGTASSTGDRFFHSLVQHLAAALQVRYALVGELVLDEEAKIQALAFWADGKFMDTIAFPLAGTPCEKVIAGEIQYFPHNVRELFPATTLLAELGVRCYLGAPIMDTVSRPLGVLAVLNSEPVIRAPNAREILRIFAARASGEIERKRTEDNLKLYREHLETVVEKRTSELKQAHEQLIHAEKLSAAGKLAASIAHEFNNPIYGIRNVLEQIGELKTLEERYKSLAGLAVRECNRVTDLIKKLQDFHRPSSGIVAPLNIHNALEDMITLSRKKMIERKIVLERKYAPEMPTIKAVGDQIRQVFLNLIQNAEEAIPETGGKIVIATQVTGDDIIVRIQDNGCGIDPEIMSSIFEPFFTTKSAVKGTGLGLSVSYGIVKRHGGKIDVESKPGEGATFTVTLPLSGAL